MLNYINNNINLIKWYQSLYKDSIDIDFIIENFAREKISLFSPFDYSRFQVFIDNTLLLFNKEKIEFYYEKGYSFKAYIEETTNNVNIMSIIDNLEQNHIIPVGSGVRLFYSANKDESSPWYQVKTIRNSMAHMQYGNFSCTEYGALMFYGIYNKDKGIQKDIGIVIEPLLHDFISRFFSNYCFGLPYKHTFFSPYSIKSEQKTDEMYFYEVFSNPYSSKTYNGYESNDMKQLSFMFQKGSALEFLIKNKDKFMIQETILKKNLLYENFIKLAKERLYTHDEFVYGLKTILDPETEISNFLIHLGKLNSVLYEYSVYKKPNVCNEKLRSCVREKLIEELKELKEDENGRLAFELGFLYLMTMNFALRTEDDDYKKIKYNKIDVSGFEYSQDNVKRYSEQNSIVECAKQRYIVERVRNSLMHGNIKFNIDSNANIFFVFEDCYNKREEKVKIQLDRLNDFVRQQSLYEEIPIDSPILIMSPIE